MHFPEDEIVNSIVGQGTRFKGEIELSGLFRIDGDYIGSLRTDGKVIVGRRARAACTINALSVVVGGIFCGTIIARDRVVLLSSSLIIGSIIAPCLIVESGSMIHGEFSIVNRKLAQALPQRKKSFAYAPASSAMHTEGGIRS